MSQVKVTIQYKSSRSIKYEPGNTTLKAIHKQAKVNISVCSLKREIKVKLTKFCAGLEELINFYKLTKFVSCIINGVWGTKLNTTA